MRNSNPKIVEILDETRLNFRCKECGQLWSPNIPEGGHKLPKGSWQCPNGCKI